MGCHKLFWLLVLIPQWVAAAETQFSYGVEHFKWEEFVDGRRLVQESGLRHFVSLETEGEATTGRVVEAKGRLYLGRVDYDGETMGGDQVPTDTDYFGFQLEAGLVSHMSNNESLSLGGWSLRTAIGLDNWWRDLNDTKLSDGTPVMGYEEHYTLLYGVAGFQYRHIGGWGLDIDAKLPFWTNEEALQLTFKPKGRLSLRCGVVKVFNDRWSARLDYDSYDFGKSEPQDIYYQPESHQEIIAASVHFHF